MGKTVSFLCEAEKIESAVNEVVNKMKQSNLELESKKINETTDEKVSEVILTFKNSKQILLD